MNVAAWIDTLRREGQLLGDAAARAGLTSDVPTCPGWTVRDLVLHIGGVHRWAAATVAQARSGPLILDEPYDIVEQLPSDTELVDWFRDGHAGLVRTLEQAPADLRCWQVLPAPSAIECWSRRQAHETAVHRVDADLASGPGTSAPVSPEFAADGVDELVTCFVARRNKRLRAKQPTTLRFQTTDTGDAWLVGLGSELPTAQRVPATDETAADTVVTGPAATLYLALWNRLPWSGLTVSGADTAQRTADRWSSAVHVRWS